MPVTLKKPRVRLFDYLVKFKNPIKGPHAKIVPNGDRFANLFVDGAWVASLSYEGDGMVGVVCQEGAVIASPVAIGCAITSHCCDGEPFWSALQGWIEAEDALLGEELA